MHLIGVPALSLKKKSCVWSRWVSLRTLVKLFVGGGGNCPHNVISVHKTALLVSAYFQNILRNRSQVVFVAVFSIRVNVRNVSDDEKEKGRESVVVPVCDYAGGRNELEKCIKNKGLFVDSV